MKSPVAPHVYTLPLGRINGLFAFPRNINPKVTCKLSRTGYELGSACPVSMSITVTARASNLVDSQNRLIQNRKPF